jgi:Nucleotidyltransferase of unknown function (DUF6036)
MATRDEVFSFDAPSLERAFETLSMRLQANDSDSHEIVVCGGSALILTGVVLRTTSDVDVVALGSYESLASPDPLPESLACAARETAEDLGLDLNWLNNGPSRGEGGLFQMGLPDGIQTRWLTRVYGSRLTVHFIGRLDQIHFKTYASADRGGYHIEDLLALDPTDDELVLAARWAMTHDVSDTFASILKHLFRSIDHGPAADRL